MSGKSGGVSGQTLSIGVISCNRLRYLRATLESARRCIQFPHIQWIVVDNGSTEPGLRDYLRSLTWIDDLVLREGRSPKTEHVAAMNTLVERARGETLLIWPEDVQFIVAGDWMVDCVDILRNNPWIGGMGLSAIRRSTIWKTWGLPRWRRMRALVREVRRYGRNFRHATTVRSSRGFPVKTFGWATDGIVGSGIPSLTRTDVWRKLGPWKAAGGTSELIDSSGGGETEMLARWRKTGWALQRALPILPLAADIVDDEIGTKAKIRGDNRYGPYRMPPEGTYYYKIYEQSEVEHLANRPLPVPFEDFVQPIGYQLPLDRRGGLLKAAINTSVVRPIA